MIVHLVLARPGSDLSAAAEQEMIGALDALRRVPGVHSMTCGRDFSGRGKGYSAAAVIHFASREELTAYARDPLHLEVIETLNRLGVERLVIDYETEMSGIST